MRRKHSRMMAIILSTIILAGCSNSSHLSVSQTHSSPSATAQPRPTAEPLAVSVSPERSCYQQLYDQPDNPNWALYAEITITNYTDQPLTIETIFLYPNHQFYGEDASTPVLLPEDAIVALRETGLWELHADQISLDSCPVHETWPFGENQLEFPLELEAGQSQTGNIYIPGGTDMTTGLPMAPYTLDVRTSMGDFSYYGMAIAPSGNGWGTYKTSAGRIENIQAAEHLARFLEDSQLLLWLAPSTFVAMESKSTLAADDTIYHAVSATILYLTAQSKIQVETKRLDNLELLDSERCEQVASVRDLYGTTHSVSYKFDPWQEAWAKFKLDGRYDTFEANILTSDDTSRDANISVEIYVDDVLVGRVDNIVRDENVRPISVSVNGGKVLMIKAINTDSASGSICYVSDTNLTVLQ